MKTFNYNLKHDKIDFFDFKNEKNILIQIFCGEGKEKLEDISSYLLKNLPNAICIGSTTDGEINEDEITTQNSIISISIFNETQISVSYRNEHNSFENGFNLAKDLVIDNTKLLILFSDGSTSNGEEFLKGIESFNPHIPICGGMAGDNGKFTQTYISQQNRIYDSGAVGVALNSDVLFVQNDYKFNWSPIGIEHKIDKAVDNRVYSIDGITPVEFYKKYLGNDVAQALPATGIEFPLIINKDSIPTARAVIAKHKDGSLSFAGNLKEGDWVKLGFGNAEMIMQSKDIDAQKISNIKVESFFIYSCMARRRYMPDFIQIEIEPFSNIASTSGFFTYGEFYHKDGRNRLLNQTLTSVALSESTKEKSDNKSKIIKDQKISDYARTIQALTHLIQQATNDYDKQTKKLNEEKVYSQNLIESQKKFLRHAVHETNTPLSIIMGNIELFEMEHEKNKYISNIEVAMKNLFTIYDDLSYLVKKDQLEYTKQKIDLVDYLRSRCEFFKQVALKVNSDFILSSKKNSMIIDFNETKLQRIVDNNLTNAIKYSFENEKIFIDLYEENEYYIFKVSSHSTVIQEPEKIFEEYYREEKSQEGFGLGLNLVKRVCEEEGIKIQVESSKKITSFTYSFKKGKK